MNGTYKYRISENFSTERIRHGFSAVFHHIFIFETVPVPHQMKFIERGAVLVLHLSGEGDHFSGEGFEHVSDGHAGRNAVRVDDHIGGDSVDAERHVFLAVDHADRSFLAMSGSKFIPNFRNSDGPSFYFGYFFVVGILSNYYSIDCGRFGGFCSQRGVLRHIVG